MLEKYILSKHEKYYEWHLIKTGVDGYHHIVEDYIVYKPNPYNIKKQKMVRLPDEFKGNITLKEWEYNNVIYSISREPSGITNSLSIIDNNMCITRYYDDGNNISHILYTNNNGEFHREDGPAFIIYNKDETINHTEWYLDGEYIDHDIMPSWPLTIDQQIEFKFKYG